MLSYDQPKFYRFSEDSLILAAKGFELFNKDYKDKYKRVTLVDAFSGCGVVGLEFLLLFKNIQIFKKVYFIEKNRNMISFCEENIARFNSDQKIHQKLFEIINEDFFNLSIKRLKKDTLTFFLINPPYFAFNPKRGSKDHDRNSCRFFEKDFSVLDILKKLDDISFENKVAGLILYRVDQVKKIFTQENQNKFKRIRISKVNDPRLNSFTSLIYFES